jgi:hypothetical protein
VSGEPEPYGPLDLPALGRGLAAMAKFRADTDRLTSAPGATADEVGRVSAALLAMFTRPAGDGPPYTHTLAAPEPVWVACRDCEGSGGRPGNGPGSWVDCDTCQGEEGWLPSPALPPSMTIVDWPPKDDC